MPATRALLCITDCFVQAVHVNSDAVFTKQLLFRFQKVLHAYSLLHFTAYADLGVFTVLPSLLSP